MKAINLAIKRVAACEAEIKALMTSLVTEGKYEELPAVAAMAARLADVISGDLAIVKNLDAHAPTRLDAAAPQGNDTHGPKLVKQKRGYPRFERSEDRLIKIGWSTKDRQEYEHKASKATVRAVFDAIADAATSRDFVRVEDVLRVRSDHEEEIPSYQIYIVIAWLRGGGALEKEGNEGYRIKKKGLSFERLWNTTPAR